MRRDDDPFEGLADDAGTIVDPFALDPERQDRARQAGKAALKAAFGKEPSVETSSPPIPEPRPEAAIRAAIAANQPGKADRLDIPPSERDLSEAASVSQPSSAEREADPFAGGETVVPKTDATGVFDPVLSATRPDRPPALADPSMAIVSELEVLAQNDTTPYGQIRQEFIDSLKRDRWLRAFLASGRADAARTLLMMATRRYARSRVSQYLSELAANGVALKPHELAPMVRQIEQQALQEATVAISPVIGMALEKVARDRKELEQSEKFALEARKAAEKLALQAAKGAKGTETGVADELPIDEFFRNTKVGSQLDPVYLSLEAKRWIRSNFKETQWLGMTPQEQARAIKKWVAARVSRMMREVETSPALSQLSRGDRGRALKRIEKYLTNQLELATAAIPGDFEIFNEDLGKPDTTEAVAAGVKEEDSPGFMTMLWGQAAGAAVSAAGGLLSFVGDVAAAVTGDQSYREGSLARLGQSMMEYGDELQESTLTEDARKVLEAASEKVDKGQWWDAATDVLTSPSAAAAIAAQMVGFVVGSGGVAGTGRALAAKAAQGIAAKFAGRGIARAAAAGTARVLKSRAAVTGTAAVAFGGAQGAQEGHRVYKEIMQTPVEALKNTPAFHATVRAMQQEGKTPLPEEVKERMAHNAAATASLLGASISAGSYILFGGVNELAVGRLPLLRKVMPQVATGGKGGLASAILTGARREALQEGMESGGLAFAREAALADATQQDPDMGAVLGQAGSEAAFGAVLGAAAGGALHGLGVGGNVGGPNGQEAAPGTASSASGSPERSPAAGPSASQGGPAAPAGQQTQAQPAQPAEPAQAEPAQAAEPVQPAEPAQAEPAQAESAQPVEPAQAEPAQAESVQSEPTKPAEPAQAEPAQAEPAQAAAEDLPDDREARKDWVRKEVTSPVTGRDVVVYAPTDATIDMDAVVALEGARMAALHRAATTAREVKGQLTELDRRMLSPRNSSFWIQEDTNVRVAFENANGRLFQEKKTGKWYWNGTEVDPVTNPTVAALLRESEIMNELEPGELVDMDAIIARREMEKALAQQKRAEEYIAKIAAFVQAKKPALLEKGIELLDPTGASFEIVDDGARLVVYRNARGELYRVHADPADPTKGGDWYWRSRSGKVTLMGKGGDPKNVLLRSLLRGAEEVNGFSRGALMYGASLKPPEAAVPEDTEPQPGLPPKEELARRLFDKKFGLRSSQPATTSLGEVMEEAMQRDDAESGLSDDMGDKAALLVPEGLQNIIDPIADEKQIEEALAQHAQAADAALREIKRALARKAKDKKLVRIPPLVVHMLSPKRQPLFGLDATGPRYVVAMRSNAGVLYLDLEDNKWRWKTHKRTYIVDPKKNLAVRTALRLAERFDGVPKGTYDYLRKPRPGDRPKKAEPRPPRDAVDVLTTAFMNAEALYFDRKFEKEGLPFDKEKLRSEAQSMRLPTLYRVDGLSVRPRMESNQVVLYENDYGSFRYVPKANKYLWKAAAGSGMDDLWLPHPGHDTPLAEILRAAAYANGFKDPDFYLRLTDHESPTWNEDAEFMNALLGKKIFGKRGLKQLPSYRQIGRVNRDIRPLIDSPFPEDIEPLVKRVHVNPVEIRRKIVRANPYLQPGAREALDKVEPYVPKLRKDWANAAKPMLEAAGRENIARRRKKNNIPEDQDVKIAPMFHPARFRPQLRPKDKRVILYTNFAGEMSWRPDLRAFMWRSFKRKGEKEARAPVFFKSAPEGSPLYYMLRAVEQAFSLPKDTLAGLLTGATHPRLLAYFAKGLGKKPSELLPPTKVELAAERQQAVARRKEEAMQMLADGKLETLLNYYMTPPAERAALVAGSRAGSASGAATNAQPATQSQPSRHDRATARQRAEAATRVPATDPETREDQVDMEIIAPSNRPHRDAPAGTPAGVMRGLGIEEKKLAVVAYVRMLMDMGERQELAWASARQTFGSLITNAAWRTYRNNWTRVDISQYKDRVRGLMPEATDEDVRRVAEWIKANPQALGNIQRRIILRSPADMPGMSPTAPIMFAATNGGQDKVLAINAGHPAIRENPAILGDLVKAHVAATLKLAEDPQARIIDIAVSYIGRNAQRARMLGARWDYRTRTTHVPDPDETTYKFLALLAKADHKALYAFREWLRANVPSPLHRLPDTELVQILRDAGLFVPTKEGIKLTIPAGQRVEAPERDIVPHRQADREVEKELGLDDTPSRPVQGRPEARVQQQQQVTTQGRSLDDLRRMLADKRKRADRLQKELSNPKRIVDGVPVLPDGTPVEDELLVLQSEISDIERTIARTLAGGQDGGGGMPPAAAASGGSGGGQPPAGPGYSSDAFTHSIRSPAQIEFNKQLKRILLAGDAMAKLTPLRALFRRETNETIRQAGMNFIRAMRARAARHADAAREIGDWFSAAEARARLAAEKLGMDVNTFKTEYMTYRIARQAPKRNRALWAVNVPFTNKEADARRKQLIDAIMDGKGDPKALFEEVVRLAEQHAKVPLDDVRYGGFTNAEAESILQGLQGAAVQDKLEAFKAMDEIFDPLARRIFEWRKQSGIYAGRAGRIVEAYDFIDEYVPLFHTEESSATYSPDDELRRATESAYRPRQWKGTKPSGRKGIARHEIDLEKVNGWANFETEARDAAYNAVNVEALQAMRDLIEVTGHTWKIGFGGLLRKGRLEYQGGKSPGFVTPELDTSNPRTFAVYNPRTEEWELMAVQDNDLVRYLRGDMIDNVFNRDTLGGRFMKFMRGWTYLQSRTFTTFRPKFLFASWFRELASAPIIAANQYGLSPTRMAREIIRRTMLMHEGGYTRNLYRFMTATDREREEMIKDPAFARQMEGVIERWRAGGFVTFRAFEGREDIAAIRNQATTDPNWLQKLGQKLDGNGRWLARSAKVKEALRNNPLADRTKALIHFFEGVATLGDNIHRQVLFDMLRAKGYSPEEAAEISRDYMDFNKQGRMMRNLNTFYAFAQASFTGITTMFTNHLWKEGAAPVKVTKGQDGNTYYVALDVSRVPEALNLGAVGFFIIAGAAKTLLAAELMGQDDKGEDNAARINSNTWFFYDLLPFGTDGSALKLPKQYGLQQLFEGLGTLAVLAAKGYYSAKELTVTFFNHLARNLFPLDGLTLPHEVLTGQETLGFGTVKTLASFATPTVFKPVAEVVTNRTTFGAPVHAQGDAFGKKEPWEMGYVGTPLIYEDIARFANRTLGLPLKPEDVEHMVAGMVPFVGPLLKDVGRTAVAVTSRPDRGIVESIINSAMVPTPGVAYDVRYDEMDLENLMRGRYITPAKRAMKLAMGRPTPRERALARAETLRMYPWVRTVERIDKRYGPQLRQLVSQIKQARREARFEDARRYWQRYMDLRRRRFRELSTVLQAYGITPGRK